MRLHVLKAFECLWSEAWHGQDQSKVVRKALTFSHTIIGQFQQLNTIPTPPPKKKNTSHHYTVTYMIIELLPITNSVMCFDFFDFDDMFWNWNLIPISGFADSSPSSKFPPSESGLITDAKTVWDWLLSRGSEASKINLLGHSLGTGVTVGLLHLLDLQHLPGPATITLTAPFTSLPDLLSQYPISDLLITVWEFSLPFHFITSPWDSILPNHWSLVFLSLSFFSTSVILESYMLFKVFPILYPLSFSPKFQGEQHPSSSSSSSSHFFCWFVGVFIIGYLHWHFKSTQRSFTWLSRFPK